MDSCRELDRLVRSVTSLPHLRSQTPESLAALWPDLSISTSLARKIVSRLVVLDRDDLAGVSGLSMVRAEALRARARTDRLTVIDRRHSQLDPFVKYLFRAPDGGIFEAVRIPLEKPRWSVCVSSQIGCGLGCAFCETGRLGFTRNLAPWEMVEQVLTIRREAPERPLWSIVFQGQGEPFQNYENVMQAAAILRDSSGGQIRGERITISTVGFPALIDRFREEGLPYRLILSLTSTFPDLRAELLPVGRKTDLAELAASMMRLARARREPVSLAWVMIRGVNTGPEEAAGIARLFPGTGAPGIPVRLSLIDVNDSTGRLQPPDADERSLFLDALRAHNINFVRRYSGGADIRASCGLLSSSSQGGDFLPPPFPDSPSVAHA